MGLRVSHYTNSTSDFSFSFLDPVKKLVNMFGIALDYKIQQQEKGNEKERISPEIS